MPSNINIASVCRLCLIEKHKNKCFKSIVGKESKERKIHFEIDEYYSLGDLELPGECQETIRLEVGVLQRGEGVRSLLIIQNVAIIYFHGSMENSLV